MQVLENNLSWEEEEEEKKNPVVDFYHPEDFVKKLHDVLDKWKIGLSIQEKCCAGLRDNFILREVKEKNLVNFWFKFTTVGIVIIVMYV